VSQETPEDRTILSALDAPDGGIGVSAHTGLPKTARDETAETLARLYTEVLGLLPLELEPRAPRPELKERLMASLAAVATPAVADEVQAPAPALPAAEPPVASREVATEPAAPPAAPPEPRPSQEVRIPHPATLPAPPPPPPRRWPLALAAALALIFAGLSGVLGYLVSEQRVRMNQLEADLDKARDAETRARRAEAQADRAHADMLKMRESLSLVTTPSVLVMPLRPQGDSAPQPDAKGVLFVAADHQHWHLALHQLRPAEPGRQYQLWFATDDGRTVSGGTFTVRGPTVTMSSPTMPTGTVAASITVEPAGGSISPTGPEVLKTNEAFQLS